MEAIAALQHSLVAVTVLALPRSEGYLKLETDSWDKQIRSVMMQNQSDRGQELLLYWYLGPEWLYCW